MGVPEVLPNPVTDTLLVRLAREIAVEVRDLDEILKTYKVTSDQWETIRKDPRFTQILESEVVAWNSAVNVHDRIKLKSAILVEEWLEEANSRLHDGKELLSAKVELGKLLARFADVGLSKAGVEGVGERFTVTINLGADAQLKFEKEVSPKVIDHEGSE